MFVLYVANKFYTKFNFADDTSIMVDSYKEDDHKMKVENTYLVLTKWFAGNGLIPKPNINKLKWGMNSL